MRKMMSNTSMMSTSGVVLISDIGASSPPLSPTLIAIGLASCHKISVMDPWVVAPPALRPVQRTPPFARGEGRGSRNQSGLLRRRGRSSDLGRSKRRGLYLAVRHDRAENVVREGRQTAGDRLVAAL